MGLSPNDLLERIAHSAGDNGNWTGLGTWTGLDGYTSHQRRGRGRSVQEMTGPTRRAPKLRLCALGSGPRQPVRGARSCRSEGVSSCRALSYRFVRYGLQDEATSAAGKGDGYPVWPGDDLVGDPRPRQNDVVRAVALSNPSVISWTVTSTRPGSLVRHLIGRVSTRQSTNNASCSWSTNGVSEDGGAEEMWPPDAQSPTSSGRAFGFKCRQGSGRSAAVDSCDPGPL